MKKLNMFCLSLDPNHFNFIKQLGYKPVGLGENNFNKNWLSDKSGKSIVNKSEFKMKGGEVFVNYTNWSRKMEKKYWDNVSVSISNNDTLKWMSNNYGAK